jgi:diguanylate cyclase (GGDEF)-like protein
MDAVSEQAALEAALAALWTHHRDDVVDLVADIRAFVESGLGTGDAVAAAETAERAAHRLAGSLGTFGLADASGLARQLEEMIDLDRRVGGGDLALARELVARLDAEVAAFDADKPPSAPLAPPPGGPPAVREGRVIGLVGLDGTLAARISDEAARRHVDTQSFADLRALDDEVVAELDAVVVDIDRVHLDVLGPGGWATTRPPFVALSVGRRLADRVAAARLGARRYLLLPAGPDAVYGTVDTLWEQIRHMPTVLAVDDDPAVLDTLRVLLSGDIKVLAVDDQEQFWKSLHEHAPDVVILDVDMPDITGIELCRVMRNDERWQQTGIIFLTAHRDATTMHSIFDAGADDMVVKPIIGPELQARVNTRIERTELHRRLAEADGLTGLANRSTAERALERMMGRAGSDGRPVSVALVDLDHFKRVNDLHGHRAGDDVLRRFAEVVALGEPTLAGRWGGEEFIVAFDGVAAADAVERVELVLDSFRMRSFVDPDGVTFTCTFSAGIAEFPIEATTVSDLLGAADSALYEAKARGRAQVLGVGALVGRRDAAPTVVDIVTVLDDDDDATAIAGALSHDGWHVVSLGDGHEAVRRLVGPLADLVAPLVVLDADAGGLDAITVLHRLKRAGVPSEVLVAARTPHAAAEAVTVGAAGAIPKPVVPAHVRDVVRESLARLGPHPTRRRTDR